jgi:hypothetical protein
MWRMVQGGDGISNVGQYHQQCKSWHGVDEPPCGPHLVTKSLICNKHGCMVSSRNWGISTQIS